ncbi:immunoglobulin domain-containing protein [Acanthopleuribacter pedis]|uniref:Ig-like domain-containing protein n=1 Tax=Acanthopleuribacter pedis TaxID=442870 RepID=A0A8J7QKI6_9BACT|nr:immunoglobulin domain-containing protein [Acanthopleuribacter pedis]MBO1322706.1 Ig-like domain-containing protein [Acanthopleuribacter pedis]
MLSRRFPYLFAVVMSFCLGCLPLAAQGFPNVPQTPGTLIAGPIAPQQGRTAVITIQGGWLFTFPEVPSSGGVTFNGQPLQIDYLMRQWDISDLGNIREIANFGRTTQGFDAHGVVHTGDWTVFGTFQFHVDSFGGPVVVEPYTASHVVPFGRGGLFPPYSMTNFWSYNDTNVLMEFNKNGSLVARWDHIAETGIIAHPVLMGNLLFMLSEQTNGGIAIYDMSQYMDGNPSNDPEKPPLISLATQGGFGGYWAELYGLDGRLYAVNSYRIGGQGLRVVDVTDPTNPGNLIDIAFDADVMSMYPHFQDNHIFSGSSKVDMRSFEVVLTLPTETTHTFPGYDDGDGMDTSQWLLPIGNLLVTGGLTDLDRSQGMAIWAHQAEPDTRGPMVGYHIPRAGQTNYPVEAPISMIIPETLDTSTLIAGQTFIVRPLGGNPISGSLWYAMNDMITFQPDQPLQDDTTYEVFLPQGGIEDAVGNGMEENYSFTFSTGSSSQGNQPPEITSFTVSDGSITPNQNVTFNATGSDPENEQLEWRFVFGDGTDPTPWSTTASASHTYTEVGHRRAVVQTRDSSGVTVSDSLIVTIANPVSATPPTHSSQIIMDETARRVYAANPDNNTVAVIHADNHNLIREIPTAADPRNLGLDHSGNLWVTAYDADQIQVFDPSNGSLVDQIDLDYGSLPLGLVFSPDRNTVYVSLSGKGSLLRFNASTRQQTGSLALGPTARALAVDGNHTRILVTRFISDAYHGEVWDVNASSFTLQRTFILPQKLTGDNSGDGAGVPNYLAGITISPDNSSAYISTVKTNINKGVRFGDGSLNDPDNTVRTEVMSLDLVANQTRMDNADRIDLDNSDSVRAFDFTPLGDYMLLVNQGTNDVMIMDTFRFPYSLNLGSMVARVGVGMAPQGVVVDSAGQQVFVKNFMSRSVSTFSIANLLAVGDTSFQVSTINTVQNELLSASVLLGKQVFYNAGDPRMSLEGYISCASCHVDGGHDGRTWDFTQRGEGFRNTPPLWGRAGIGHGRVHWTANFDEIQDFENDIRGNFGGEGFLSENDFGQVGDPLGPPKAGRSAELDAMSDYLTSLDASTLPRSPFRQANGDMTSDAVAGAQVFIEQNCASCHNPAQEYTDRQIRNVGTIRQGTSGTRINGPLEGLETPTLLGLWDTAPYLHDGSAPDLETVFRTASGTWYDNELGTNIGGFQNNTFPFNTWLGGTQTPLSRNQDRSIRWDNVDGGSGGTGQITVRFATDFNQGDIPLELTVNGATRTVNFPATLPDQSSRPFLIIENVSLQAGTTNSITLRNNRSFEALDLDAIFVSTADDLVTAAPHRRVMSLSGTQRNQLIAYLQQLDGRNVVTSGAVERRYWTGVAGGTLGALENDGRFPDEPTGADVLNGLEVVGWAGSANPGGAQNWGDNYGQQVRGYIVAPQSGNYRFYLSGDDVASFRLSTDTNPANAVEIAALTSASGFRTWTGGGNQVSAEIALVSGNRYFFELLHVEGGSGDHVAVAWQLPGGGAPVNGSADAVVPGSALAPFGDTFRVVPPNAPDNLMARSYSPTEIHLAFTDRSNNEFGHHIEYRFNGGEWQQVDLGPTGGIDRQRDHAIERVFPGAAYQVRVRSYNTAGNSAWTDPVDVVMIDAATQRLFSYDGNLPFAVNLGVNLLQKAEVFGSNLALWRADGGFGQRSAVWSQESLPTDRFVSEFTLRSANETAGGVSTFVVAFQSSSPNETALGNEGGYEGINGPKIGLIFSLFEGSSSVKLLNNDATVKTYFSTLDQNFSFDYSTSYRFRVIYDNRQQDLSLEWIREDNNATFVGSFPIDVESVLGSHAYMGFVVNSNFTNMDMTIDRWVFDHRVDPLPRQAPFGGTALTAPTRVQMEDYDEGGEGIAFNDNDDFQSGFNPRGDSVDFDERNGSQGPYIGWSEAGEWLKYTLEIPSGVYNISLRAGAGSNSTTDDVILSLDGVPLTVFDVANTNFNFQTHTNSNVVIARGGLAVIRVTQNRGGSFLDWFEFQRVGDVSGVPATPSGFSANAVDSGRIDVGFTDQASNETGFVVEYRRAGEHLWQSTTWAPLAGSGTNGTLQMTGLARNTTYQLRVKAFNDTGDSGWSTVQSATTQNAGGCTTPVRFVREPASVAACAGEEVRLTALANGDADPATSYQWYFQGSPINGETGPEYVVASFGAGAVGDYFCRISNSCGSADSQTVALSLSSVIEITDQPDTQDICVGANATFDVAADGSANFTYQWYFGNTALEGETNSVLSLENVGANQAGQYRCRVTGTCGEAFSEFATLSVEGIPVFTEHPQPGAGCPGARIELSALATGNSLSYQWYLGNNPINGATSPTYVIQSLTEGQAGNYRCRVSNDCGGGQFSNIATVSIGDDFNITDGPGNLERCAGQSVTMSVSVEGPVTGYQWFFNNVALNGETGSSLSIGSVSEANAGNYFCRITGECSTTDSPVGSLVISGPPSITQQPQDVRVCPGQTLRVSVGAQASGALSYQWYRNNVRIVGATSAAFEKIAEASDVGTYLCRVETACSGVWTGTATVTLGDSFSINTQPEATPACTGESIVLSVGVTGSFDNLQWYRDSSPLAGQTNNTLNLTNLQPSDSGRYFARINGFCSSQDSAAVSLDVSSGPTIVQEPVDIGICEGLRMDLSVQATSGNGPLTYQWYGNGTRIDGATQATYSKIAENSDAGEYICRVTDSCGGIWTARVNAVLDQAVAQVATESLALGLQPPVLEAVVGCIETPSVVWWNSITGNTLGLNVNPATVNPPPTETTPYRVRVRDEGGDFEVILEVLILVPTDARFRDFNDDGCNDVEDMQAAAAAWSTQTSTLDANSDGDFNILDMVYINTTDGCNP